MRGTHTTNFILTCGERMDFFFFHNISIRFDKNEQKQQQQQNV